MYIHPYSYKIVLRTGEILQISEFNVDRLEDRYKDVVISRPYPLNEVPYITDEIVQDLKAGYDKKFLPNIGVPPSIKIMKLKEKRCSERHFCASYNPKSCLLEPKPKNFNSFPKCFMFEHPDKILQEIMTTIIFLWLENQYVFFVI